MTYTEHVVVEFKQKISEKRR